MNFPRDMRVLLFWSVLVVLLFSVLAYGLFRLLFK
jgi:hypothetical protein